MDLLDDFGRVKRWAFGVKGASPQYKNALQRILERMEPKVPRAAILSERNATRRADRHKRVKAIRTAVRNKLPDVLSRRRQLKLSERGAILDAIRAVAGEKSGSKFNKVRKLYYAKDVPDPHAKD